MKRFKQLGIVLLALLVTCCSGGKGPAGTANSSGNQKGATADNAGRAQSRLCALYTSAEIKELLGAAVGEGEVAGPMGTACQWSGNSAGDDAVYAQIQLIDDPRYWEKHSGAKGYEELRGIGKEAYVATALGGWEAGTVTDKAVVFVSLSGGTASRDSAIRFLRSTLEKLGMSNK